MSEDFWRRIDDATQTETTRKELAGAAGVTVSAISMWKTRKNYPTADVALRVAKALETTVEYLVEGEAGAEYVRSVVAREGKLYRPPQRIAAIVDALGRLDGGKLETVRTMVVALAGEAESEKAQGS